MQTNPGKTDPTHTKPASQPRHSEHEPIFLSPPDVTELEEKAVARAVKSGWVAPLGPDVNAFESELASYCGRRTCVALSSGTAALHVALLSMGVGTGDIVLTSSMTFAATTNAILYTGANPIFIDCDETGNLNPHLLRESIQALEREGQYAKLILPVDMLGKVVDHRSIGTIATLNGIPVLSDAAESLGARRDGRPSASYGVAAAISFNGNKIMTTSGGGALLTDDLELASRARYLAAQARLPVAHYEHRDVGYNYRMSNILAALGRAQLTRLNEMIDARRRNRAFYRELFATTPGVDIFGEPSTSQRGETEDNYWLTTVLVEPREAGFSRNELMFALSDANIESRPMWKPMHLQPVHRGRRAFIDGTSERLFERGLSLPSGSSLSSGDRLRIHATVRNLSRSKLRAHQNNA